MEGPFKCPVLWAHYRHSQVWRRGPRLRLRGLRAGRGPSRPGGPTASPNAKDFFIELPRRDTSRVMRNRLPKRREPPSYEAGLLHHTPRHCLSTDQRRLPEPQRQRQAQYHQSHQQEKRGCHRSRGGRLQGIHPEDEHDPRDLAMPAEVDRWSAFRRRIGDLHAVLESDGPGAQEEEPQDERRHQQEPIGRGVGHTDQARKSSRSTPG